MITIRKLRLEMRLFSRLPTIASDPSGTCCLILCRITKGHRTRRPRSVAHCTPVSWTVRDLQRRQIFPSRRERSQRGPSQGFVTYQTLARTPSRASSLTGFAVSDHGKAEPAMAWLAHLVANFLCQGVGSRQPDCGVHWQPYGADASLHRQYTSVQHQWNKDFGSPDSTVSPSCILAKFQLICSAQQPSSALQEQAGSMDRDCLV